MKLLRNLLVAIAATGVMGAAQAQTTPGNTFNLLTLTPTVTVTTDTFASGSFLDTFNFTVDSTNHIVQGGTSSTNVSNLQLQLLDSGNSVLFTGLSLNQNLLPGNYHTLISGMVGTAAGGGQFTFSVAAHNPEPAEWMLMLCGLVVAGFIARRKIGLMAG
jgi:hypothetical protein